MYDGFSCNWPFKIGVQNGTDDFLKIGYTYILVLNPLECDNKIIAKKLL